MREWRAGAADGVPGRRLSLRLKGEMHMTTEWNERKAEAAGVVVRQPGAGAKVKPVSGELNFEMMALELENLRLTRLVAELLMKNQQLREKTLVSA